MIKDILLTMVIREDGIKKIYPIKTGFYVIFIIITNILFPLIFNLCASFFNSKFSELDSFYITLYELRNSFLVNFMLFIFLVTSFLIQSHGKKYFELVFKTLVAMSFINPLFIIISYWLNNLLVNFAIIIYDFVFIKAFVNTNINDEDLPKPKQAGCIVTAFLITYFLFLFWYIKI